MLTIGPSIGKIPKVLSTPPELPAPLPRLTRLFLDSKQKINSEVEFNKKREKTSESEKLPIETIIKQKKSENFIEVYLPLIFKIEILMREVLDSLKFLAKEKDQHIQDIQKTYDEVILLTLKCAKIRPIYSSAIAAASQGEAAQAGLRAIERHSQNLPPPVQTGRLLTEIDLAGYEHICLYSESPGLSSKSRFINNCRLESVEAFVLPQSKAIIMKKTPGAKEIESLVRSLLFLMKIPTTGSFNIEKASLTRFGKKFPLVLTETGFDFDKIPDALKIQLKMRLGSDDVLIFNQLEKTRKKGGKELENYEKMRLVEWRIRMITEEVTGPWEEHSFESLKAIVKKLEEASLQKDKDFFSLFVVESTQLEPEELEKGKTFTEHFLSNSPLAQALNYHPSLESPSREVYIIPDFSEDRDLEKIYQKFQKQTFTYKDEEDKTHTINFNTFIANCFLEKSMRDISPPLDLMDVDKVINKMHWKVISSELLEFDKGSAAELEDIQAKPLPDISLTHRYLPSHLLSSDQNRSKEFSGFVRHIMSNLTKYSELTAIFAGELQLMDLLGLDNIRFAPVINSHVERFQNRTFNYNSKEYSFKNLSLLYANGRLKNSKKLISFTENGTKFKVRLKNFKELEEALNLKYEIIVHDVNSALGETNDFGYFLSNGSEKNQAILPIHSALLELPWNKDQLWKDKPLSKETIDKLSDSTRDAEIRKWMKKDDSPIYKRVSHSAKIKIEKELQILLEQFNLSKIRDDLVKKRMKYDNILFGKLIKIFINHLARPDNIKTAKLWTILEEEFSTFVIRQGDTYEKIAKRTHRTVEDIKKFYPLFEFIPGKKIYLHYDLRSHSPEAQKNRERILNQLFPRASLQQQKALIERQDRRNQYLKHAIELENSTLNGKELLGQINRILSDRSTPLNSIQRQKLLNECRLMASSDDDEGINKFKEMVSSLLAPTYFNVMCSMYPFLRDNYEFYVKLYGQRGVGLKIGSTRFPLEKAIEKGKEQGGEAAEWAQIIEKRLAEHPPIFLTLNRTCLKFTR